MMRSILADAFEHHIWATLQIIDACAELTDEQLAMESPGIYGPILPTIRHTVGADRAYLSLLSGGAVAEIEEDKLDLPELRVAMEANGPVWASVIAGDLDPATPIVRHRDDGSESGAPLGVRLAQALHHGTDHRSQVCTSLTILGIEPPAIDVWDYADSDGRLTETEPTVTQGA